MTKLTKVIEFGFYLFLFLLPWQTRLIWQDAFLNNYVWEYGRFSLYGSELILWLILLLSAVWLWQTHRLAKLDFRQFYRRLQNPLILSYWLIIIFILLVGLSVVWSLNARLAYYSWIRLLEGGALFSLVLIFGFKLKKIALVWVLSATIQSLLAIGQFFSQYAFANKWLGLAEHFSTLAGSIILQTTTERWLRAYGGLPHPNILAGFLVIALLLLFYLAFEARTRAQRIFVLANLVVILPALFFTFSRSAWIAFIVSLVLLAFWLYRRRQYLWLETFFKIFILVVLLVSILTFNLLEPVKTRIAGDQDLEVASIELRFAFNEQAWQIIQARPWQGTGIGNYTLGVFQIVNAGWPGYYYQPVHNIYLLIWAELGLFAIFFWLAALAILIYLSARRVASLVGVTVFLSLFSILIISLMDHYFWTMYFGSLIFWLVLALNFKVLADSQKPPIN
ncbi:MAG: hypothetical protein A2744_04710 [Candidatus Buchananbacteria bacterium RIFCSPHIGHO2_01_FULL_44_11]|uniref:O-antigen ligase-related domain-containing protein n=1 Tax=Candidatus Buchananbacteria bacterium RIFCSPHIGHO2_01_FULL_44_11 TaxID=1797535 RepID=A0A1G1Y1Q4_9BACT|nr:MAG: hypothetical protein A2744_04710 [Candidatus Buchananbacteria bacterium RIFCSPHIGHO2_01_FULL_44_11]